MENLDKFGIEPKLLAAQIINFLVLFWVLKKLLYKPILGMIKTREEKIKAGLEAGAKGEQLLVKAKEEEKDILGKASLEARSLLDETQRRSQKVEEEMLLKAKTQSEKVLQVARARIAQEEALAEKQLEGKVATIAVDILEKILPKVLTKSDQIRILSASEKMLERNIHGQ